MLKALQRTESRLTFPIDPLPQSSPTVWHLIPVDPDAAFRQYRFSTLGGASDWSSPTSSWRYGDTGLFEREKRYGLSSVCHRRSLALSLVFRDRDRTLTQAYVNIRTGDGLNTEKTWWKTTVDRIVKIYVNVNGSALRFWEDRIGGSALRTLLPQRWKVVLMDLAMSLSYHRRPSGDCG